jgi:inner membrane protein
MKEKVTFLIKIGAVGIVALLLLIPLSMIKNLVKERSAYRHEAMDSVALSWAKSQTLIGPILVIPYVESSTIQEWNEKKRVEITRTVSYQRYLYLPPEELNVHSAIETEERYKGIYTFPVYRTKTQLAGTFEIAGVKALLEKENIQFTQNPYLVMGISDPRGIRSVPSMLWDNESVAFAPGCPNNILSDGIHAALPKFTAESEGKKVAFQYDLNLQGMGHFKVAPVGRSVSIDYTSNWPHPSFSGPYPTAESHIDESGFTSSWEISHFATNLGEAFGTDTAASFQELSTKAVGVQLINPVDVYQITDRSLKYGFLFVALTFIVFFLFEILKRLKIHPVQYGLVGIALALFFLLLLSLSEHIRFALAYLIAAGSCIGLLTYYVAYVLGSLVRAGGFGLLLTTIYATLYTLLQLEDLALLTGSVLLFLVLTVIMIITRKFDWYRLASSQENSADEANHNNQNPPPLPTLGRSAL